jgi:ATP diphosphatase
MSAGIERLLAIMARLRDPSGGCPWDREQTWRSISPHTLEEAYELADAIERDDPAAVRDELGDLLFQVVFQAQIARERGLFDFDDVAAGIGDKLERGDGTGVLDGVARALPALTRAAKFGRRAAAVGFDWSSAEAVLDKVDEEVAESRHALEQGDPGKLREELGDLLFAVAQAARYCGLDPEESLRQANDKFERRFRHIEAGLASRGLSPQQVGIDELEALWVEAKQSGI